MPRAALNRDAVVVAGAQLLDEVGSARFSLAVLADRLGVRTPSLYKHTDGLPALLLSISVRSKTELAAVLRDAATGLAGADAIRAIATAYRGWALAHPGRYPATQLPPVAGDADDEAASAAVVEVIARVLAGAGLQGDEAVHAIRFLRSAMHGFLALETAGGFGLPLDVEESWRRTVDRLVAALELADDA